MSNKEIAEHFFARNPKAEALYVTSNGKGFEKEHQADAYAQRLADRKVTKVERKDLKETDVTPAPAAETITDTTAATGGAPKETPPLPNGDENPESGESNEGGEGNEGVEETRPNLEAMTKAEIVAFATTIGLTLNTNDTKVVLIAAVDAELAKGIEIQ